MPFLDYSQLGGFLDTRGEEVRFNCPYCGDGGYHLYVNVRKGVFHCFRCSTNGKTNAALHIGTIQGLASIDGEQESSRGDRLRLPSGVPDGLTPAAERYLEKRGLLESDCVRHKIYCASPKSMYFGRLIIPVDAQPGGTCGYFTARAYTKIGWPKYLNPPGGKNSLYLSPKDPDEYHEQHWPAEHLVLVEGPFDMLKASRHGPAAALLGKTLHRPLIREIATKFEKVWIMLDRGIQETVAAMQVQNELSSLVDAEVLQCPKKDPGEMSPRDFATLFLRNIR